MEGRGSRRKIRDFEVCDYVLVRDDNGRSTAKRALIRARYMHAVDAPGRALARTKPVRRRARAAGVATVVGPSFSSLHSLGVRCRPSSYALGLMCGVRARVRSSAM